jgi:phenylalanyl-tRNA synthetase beta chain
MKLPLSWLREWIEVDKAPEAIADALTRRGFYVENVETHGHAYPGVVVARVLEVTKHPNADKLSLCRVDAGRGELRVVCGAPNVHAGMIAPLATVGATLPGGVTIKQSKIRGEDSEGMLCSSRELGISDDHGGILDLTTIAPDAATLPLGTPIERLLPPPDAVLEIEIPFNRPDGLGIVGLAREVRAAFGARWTPAAHTRLSRRWAGRVDFDLEIQDTAGCPRYIAQAFDGVKIGPSPPKLARRLEAVGQRPINNVVDVSNVVLFELGQPLHAFDLDRLHGPAIRVRRATTGERIVTLDGRERALDPEVLVIADRDRPVAVAGVMGGAETEVTDATTRLLLECAGFDPKRVRRAARALGLATEASKRYERGVDTDIGAIAVARFTELLADACPTSRPISARERNVQRPGRRTLPLRAARYERLMGTSITAPEASRHLEALEFGVTAGDPLRVTVPTWRVDVTIEDDLVEEVARSVGYEHIPTVTIATGGTHAMRSPRERLIERARRAMLALGFHEAWCTTLVSEREAMSSARLVGDDGSRLVRLTNPMSREHEVLRPNVIPGLLRACAHNLRQGRGAVRLFEVGAGFAASADPSQLPTETPMIAAVLTGARFALAHSDDRVPAKDSSLQPVDFEEAKGRWEAWLGEMRVDTPEWRAYAAVGWKPGASAEVASGTSRIGWAGTLGPQLLREWDIETPANAPLHVFLALLDPLQNVHARPRATLPGRFPPVRRDLAFFVPANVAHRDLERTLVRVAGETLDSIELFDVYAGPGTPQGMKSLAYALQFRHDERTLTESEVQATQERMVTAVSKEWDGRLRER